jgi:hypothetical protein
VLTDHIEKICMNAKNNELLKETSEQISKLTIQVNQYITKYPETLQTGAREFAFTLYRLFTG